MFSVYWVLAKNRHCGLVQHASGVAWQLFSATDGWVAGTKVRTGLCGCGSGKLSDIPPVTQRTQARWGYRGASGGANHVGNTLMLGSDSARDFGREKPMTRMQGQFMDT